MEKRKSYQELLKEYAMTQNQNESKAVEWYVDYFLNDLLQQQYEKQLRLSIDQALDRKDKEAFISQSTKLIKLIGK